MTGANKVILTSKLKFGNNDGTKPIRATSITFKNRKQYADSVKELLDTNNEGLAHLIECVKDLK